jgi:hypothetical protein
MSGMPCECGWEYADRADQLRVLRQHRDGDLRDICCISLLSFLLYLDKDTQLTPERQRRLIEPLLLQFADGGEMAASGPHLPGDGRSRSHP